MRSLRCVGHKHTIGAIRRWNGLTFAAFFCSNRFFFYFFFSPICHTSLCFLIDSQVYLRSHNVDCTVSNNKIIKKKKKKIIHNEKWNGSLVWRANKHGRRECATIERRRWRWTTAYYTDFGLKIQRIDKIDSVLGAYRKYAWVECATSCDFSLYSIFIFYFFSFFSFEESIHYFRFLLSPNCPRHWPMGTWPIKEKKEKVRTENLTTTTILTLTMVIYY